MKGGREVGSPWSGGGWGTYTAERSFGGGAGFGVGFCICFAGFGTYASSNC